MKRVVASILVVLSLSACSNAWNNGANMEQWCNSAPKCSCYAC
jgi:uncharacterized lipoprotein